MAYFCENRLKPLFPALLIALATLALYFTSRSFSFQIIDDPEYVINNDMVKGGLSLWGLKTAFTTVYESYWIPLTWLSLMADFSLWGMDAGGFHLTNALLHALNVLLFYLFLKNATGSTVKSLLAAALFSFHPLRVESVAWITARKDLLSAFFFLLSLNFWLEYVKNRSKKWYWWSFFALGAGLMAKPALVVAPLLFFTLDIWPFRRLESAGWRKIISEKIPFALLAALFSATTLFTQRAAIYSTPLADRVATVASTYAHYLQKTFWPFHLVIQDSLAFKRAGLGAALAILALLAAIKLAVWVKRRELGAAAAGWFWFLAALAPVCGILPVGVNAVADRFTYIPHLGLMAALVWGAGYLLEGFDKAKKPAALLGAALAALLWALSFNQLLLWKDTFTLYSYQVRENPSAYVETVLAMANAERGDYDEAVRLYRSSFDKNPLDPLAYRNLGVALGRSGRLKEALAAFQRAASMLPEDPESHYNMAVAAYEAGNIPLALQSLDGAISRKPDHFKARYMKGTLLARYGSLPDALAELDRAVALRPLDPYAPVERGETLGRLGRYQEALESFKKAIENNPQNPAAHFNAGLALRYEGKRAEAAPYFEKAFALAPNDSELMVKYASILEGEGDFRAAADYYRRALSKNPSDGRAAEGLSRVSGR